MKNRIFKTVGFVCALSALLFLQQNERKITSNVNVSSEINITEIQSEFNRDIYGVHVYSREGKKVAMSMGKIIDVSHLETGKNYYLRIFFNEKDSSIRFFKKV